MIFSEWPNIVLPAPRVIVAYPQLAALFGAAGLAGPSDGAFVSVVSAALTRAITVLPGLRAEARSCCWSTLLATA
ncbi:hypothetical protein [Streptomyces californicus]|uniref:hypothetical protein n=1 Tax=Streptomyces californicus TaxID=67351 RepID=UPI0037981A2E